MFVATPSTVQLLAGWLTLVAATTLKAMLFGLPKLNWDEPSPKIFKLSELIMGGEMTCAPKLATVPMRPESPLKYPAAVQPRALSWPLAGKRKAGELPISRNADADAVAEGGPARCHRCSVQG